jgi:phosphatidylinositol alpha-mannosyltransferase
MRIGMYHVSLPEPGRKPGGVEVFVHRLADRLGERGHAVTVASCSEAPPGAHYKTLPVRPARVGRSRLGRLFVNPVALNFLDWPDLDVLHLHGDDWFFRRRPAPSIRTFYGSSLLEAMSATRRRRRLSQLLVFALERRSAALATVSYGIGPDSRLLYPTAGTLPCGVDIPATYAPAEERENAIMFLGTWEGRKRGRYLRDVFLRTVAPHVPDAELWMVADQGEPADRVHIIRNPDDETVRSLYRRAAVFCLPSVYEGFGIPYIEAMAEGTPVVASPNIGAEMVLDRGRHGVIASDEALGRTLVRLLNDPVARARLAILGRARADQYSWPVVCEAHERAYEAALAGSPAASFDVAAPSGLFEER